MDKKYIKKKLIKLNLGCGIVIYKDFINVDKYVDIKELKRGANTKKGLYQKAVYEKGGKFVKADIRNLPFRDNYADEVEMHQVIEHFNILEIVNVFKEVRRVMKKGARLLISTPNFTALAKEWVENQWLEDFFAEKGTFNMNTYFNLNEQIYGNQIGGIGETHLTAITPGFLQWAFTVAGFKDIIIWCEIKGKLVPAKLGLASKNRKNKVHRCETIYAIVKK